LAQFPANLFQGEAPIGGLFLCFFRSLHSGSKRGITSIYRMTGMVMPSANNWRLNHRRQDVQRRTPIRSRKRGSGLGNSPVIYEPKIVSGGNVWPFWVRVQHISSLKLGPTGVGPFLVPRNNPHSDSFRRQGDAYAESRTSSRS
jgi:hypothetical protein